jgi:hypothetical protein
VASYASDHGTIPPLSFGRAERSRDVPGPAKAKVVRLALNFLPSRSSSAPRPPPRASIAAQGLGLVPLLVGLLFGALVLPRGAAPEEIPLPRVDGRVLSHVVADDDARAARVETEPLASAVRAVGSALRSFNAAEANHADAVAITLARDELGRTLREAPAEVADGLIDLRAFQLAHFLVETRTFERTGVASDELLERMTKVGWCENHHLVMPDTVRRVAFKLTWNHTTQLDHDPRFALTLDETRVLYAFYFTHPHASEEQRARFAAAMSAAPDAVACERAEEMEAKATAVWLLGKIAELGKIDPTYPTSLGQAAALFLKHDYAGAAMIYQTWLESHPAGEWTLRVKNHLQAAMRANEDALR